MVALPGLEDRMLVRLHTFDKALAVSDGAYLSSGSLQSSRFMITADACLQPTRKGRFSESRHVSRETMVSTLCPPASTPFIRQHDYNSSRGHSPAPRIKGPTSHHDILAPFVFPLTAKDPVLRHKDSTCTFWKFVCRTVPFPSNHLSTISVVLLQTIINLLETKTVTCKGLFSKLRDL